MKLWKIICERRPYKENSIRGGPGSWNFHVRSEGTVAGCRMRWKPLYTEYGNRNWKSPPGDSAFPIKAEIANWTVTSNKT